MALQTKIKLNGQTLGTAYISIAKTRSQKTYQKQEDGSIVEQNITWVHLGGAANREAWINGDRFNLNHVLSFEGELKKKEIYPMLKTIKIPHFELDFTQSEDIKE